MANRDISVPQGGGPLFQACQHGRIAEEGFNLNISRYISTAEQEADIDLMATHRELIEIEEQIRSATEKHNAFLKELGLQLLPGRG